MIRLNTVRRTFWIAAVCLLVTSCGRSIGSPGTTEVPGPLLIVYQEQRSCCYTEGQVSFLSINGLEYEFRPDRTGLVPLIEVPFAAGEIQVKSWQRPCDGNCDLLDAPTNQCEMSIDKPREAGPVRLLVSFDPGPNPCEIAILDVDPATTAP